MKKSLGILLCLIIMFTTTYIPIVKASSALTDSEITSIVENYLSIVGSNRYWNANIRNNQELLKNQVNNKNYLAATTTSPCKANPAHSHTDYGDEGCTSNVFTGVSRGTAQCWGFGDYIEYVIFKTTDGSLWTKHTSVNSDFDFRPGDLIWSQKNSTSQHIMVVYKTNSDGSVKIIEGNYGGKCHINTRTLNDPHSYVNYSSKSYVLTPPSSLRDSSSTPEEPETDSRPVAPSTVEVLSASGDNITENENFKISWNAGKNATEYAVCIRSLPSKEVIHYKGSIAPSANSYIYNLPVGQYDVAVITVNSNFPTRLGVNYNYSDYVEFEVKEVPRPVAPSTVEVLSVGWNNIIENENFKISWNAGKNATEYAVCIRSLPSKEVIHYKGSIDPSANSYIYNLPVGQYDVAVITVNSNFPTSLGVNYNYSNYVEFEVKEVPRPVAPSTVEVLSVGWNNIIENENFKISWNAGKNATEYAVCIRSLPSKEVIHYKGGIDPSANSYIYNLPVGQYDVAVITVNSNFPTSLGVNYNYSNYVEFEVKEVPRPVAPSTVEVLSVGWNNIIENENFKISWNAGKNATEYAVCIRSLPSKEVIHYKGGIDPSVNSYIYNLPVGQYDVAVITVNSDFPTRLGVNYNYSDYVEFEVKENITAESVVTKSGTKLIINTKVHNFEEPYDILIVGYKGKQFVTMRRVSHNKQNSPYTLEGDIDKIKIMVWSDLSTLIPLCEAEVITSSEFIKE